MKKTTFFSSLILLFSLGLLLSSCNKESPVEVNVTNTATQMQPPSSAFITNIIAGQNTDAGDVSVWNDNENLYVQYDASGDWWITESHLHVASSLGGIPQTKKGNPKVGHFDHHAVNNPHVQTFTYAIPITWGWNSELYIAAHCELVLKDNNGNVIRSETGWGEGFSFPGNNWAMYFTYFLTQPIQDFIAYYPFNGNANDESGNGNNGIIYGAALTSDRFNNPDKAYYFDGNGYILIPDNNILDLTDKISINLWVKPMGYPSTYSNIISKGDPPYHSHNAPWQISYNSQGFIDVYRLKNNNYDTEHNIFHMSLNEWTNICITFNQSEGKVKAYNNGVFIRVWEKTTPIYTDDVAITIGAQTWEGVIYGSPFGFKGVIDDVSIWDRDLTSEEIQTLYHEGGW